MHVPNTPVKDFGILMLIPRHSGVHSPQMLFSSLNKNYALINEVHQQKWARLNYRAKMLFYKDENNRDKKEKDSKRKTRNKRIFHYSLKRISP